MLAGSATRAWACLYAVMSCSEYPLESCLNCLARAFASDLFRPASRALDVAWTLSALFSSVSSLACVICTLLGFDATMRLSYMSFSDPF